MRLQSAEKYSLFEMVNDHINIFIMRKNPVNGGVLRKFLESDF